MDGFLTSTDRFVGRKETFLIAENARQVHGVDVRRRKRVPANEAVSLNVEDLPFG